MVGNGCQTSSAPSIIPIAVPVALGIAIISNICAGYSDPVTLELHYYHTSNQGIVSDDLI